MAIRWKKYHSACKGKRAEGDRYGKAIQSGINCNGKRGSYCPEGVMGTCRRWLIEFFDDTKQWQSLAFKDVRGRRDAEKRLAMFISDRERGKLNLPKRRAIPTLAEYSRKHLESHTGVKGNTLAMKQRAVNALVKFLGDYPLDKITPFIIEKYRINRKASGIKDSSINIDVSVLSHALTIAIKSGILDKNPCQGVKRLKVTQTKDRILSGNEIALLLDKLQGKDRLMVLTGLLTGLRLGGVLSLSWQDIDFSNGLITSSHKTGKLVSIPMSDYLSGELSRYRGNNPGERVFESRTLTHVVTVEYSAYFSKLFKEHGIHGFTFHGLRHTFASLLQSELGVGAVVVQGMTGHSSLGMLQKYSHTGLDNKQRAIKSLTDYVLGMNPKPSLAIAQ